MHGSGPESMRPPEWPENMEPPKGEPPFETMWPPQGRQTFDGMEPPRGEFSGQMPLMEGKRPDEQR